MASITMIVAGLVVLASGLFLVVLGLLGLARSERAVRFLRMFASSARAHYTEQTLRLMGGVAFILFAPRMWWSEMFAIFGWVVAATAIALLLVPWRWHHRFAEWVVPAALRWLRLFGVASLALGGAVLCGWWKVVSG